MKTIIATTAIALSFATTSFAAQVSDAGAFLALSNDSAAERVAPSSSNAMVDFGYVTSKLQHEDGADGQIFLGGNPETQTRGKAQLAASLGVNAADFSVSELIKLRNVQEDDSQS